jgi:uncharacterized small protein (DUF1192 family)
MSHASNSLNPTEKLKLLITELESERSLYQWLLKEKVFTNYSSEELTMRINFLTPEIDNLKKEFEN